LYVLSTIGCALTYSVIPFIVLRAFQAIGASAAQAVGAGYVACFIFLQTKPLINAYKERLPICLIYMSEVTQWDYFY
jgi:MFS family permease